jgi:transcriptional antiterminator RfaH
MIRFWQKTYWFAIQTKPCREELAAANLARLGLETLLPKAKAKARTARGKAESVIKPLFMGYLFARFCPEIQLEGVRFARGVLRVVSAGSIPVPLDEEIIPAIRARVAEDGYVHLEGPPLQPGDEVVIEGGPFQGAIGRFECEWDDRKRVSILLKAIDHVRLLVDRAMLARVETAG